MRKRSFAILILRTTFYVMERPVLDHEQVYMNLLIADQLDAFVQEAHHEQIDTAFVSLD